MNAIFENNEWLDQGLSLIHSAEEVQESREIDSFGGFVETPNLLDDSLAGNGFNGKTDDQTQHGSAAIELFTENFLWIRGVRG